MHFSNFIPFKFSNPEFYVCLTALRDLHPPPLHSQRHFV